MTEDGGSAGEGSIYNDDINLNNNLRSRKHSLNKKDGQFERIRVDNIPRFSDMKNPNKSLRLNMMQKSEVLPNNNNPSTQYG